MNIKAHYFSALITKLRLTIIIITAVLILVIPEKAHLQNSEPDEPSQPVGAAIGIEKATLTPSGCDCKERPEIVYDQAITAHPEISSNLISATTYAFTSGAGVGLEDMSSGTTLLVGANLDDNASAVTNIGFDFWYDGVRFTQYSVNANGLCRLGSVSVTTEFDNGSGTFGFNTTTNAPKIAPYFDDLWTGTNGKVHFKVTGSAPNRKLIVEWLNEQIPRVASGNAGAGTFQMWLFETTGVIEFVYGNGIALNSTNGGYSIGLQSGAATNFASVTSATSTVSYAAANNTQTNAITSGTAYIFTPNIPAAPTGLNFTSVTATSMTVNWTDNASNEFGYAIYNSTDGTNFTFVTQTAANATSQNFAGLLSSQNYFWRVFAVSEGALSTVLSGSQMTGAPGMINSTAAGGNWSAPATWVGGVVPTGTDNVTIVDGATVTIDTAAVALNVTVGQGASGVLEFESVTARTLTVGVSVTIASGGTLRSATTGTVTTHVLSIGSDLTNNGTLDFSTNGNTAGAGLTFTGATNNTFGGTGATTDIRTLTVNKGTSSASIIEVTTSNFTVQGVTTDVAGYLTLTNGTFKISGSFSGTNRVFTTAAYTIGATTGFWLNNPNYTVAGQNGSPTENGLLRISQGTFNIGTATGNSLGFSTGSTIIVEGGMVNAAGRFGVAAAANAITYTQTAGVITVCTIGNASTTLGSFDLGTSLSSAISISGGTIVCQLAASTIDYRNQAGTGITGVTGGTLQMGNAASGAAKAFNLRGVLPNLDISNTSANHSATMSTTLVNFNNISLNVTINTGTTFNCGNVVFLFNGTTLTNNGTLTHNGASSNFVWFLTTAPVSYTGNGTVTAPMTNMAIQADMGLTFSPASPNVVVGAIRLFSGSVTNANKITLGNGGATTGIVQIGNTTTPTAAGTFDVSFTFNLGTGGQTLSYLRTTAARATGPEINPTRIATSLTYDDNDASHNLTLTGGDLTLASTATALTLTNGRFITGANNLILSSGTATVTRTNGLVDGNFTKTYAAAASKTFEVGTANGFSPVTVNVTAGTFPTTFTVKAVQGAQPNLAVPTKALQRYWTLTATGVTADLTFNYLDPTDIPVTANEALFFIFKWNGSWSAPGGTVNTAANMATITGVTSFSDWTLAEPTGPTAVNLSAFNATAFDEGTLLEWQTGFEVSNLGFRIWREEGGKRQLVNQQIIAGSALTRGTSTVLQSGDSYTWWDKASTPSVTYWLEDLDLNGLSTWRGPFSTVGKPTLSGNQKIKSQQAKTLAQFNTDIAETDTSRVVQSVAATSGFEAANQAKVEQVSIANQKALKIAVKREGWYRVSQAELATSGFNTQTDPAKLQLLVEGREVPIAVLLNADKQLEAIEFFGIGFDNPTSELRNYWLIAGDAPGKRIQRIKGEGAPSAATSFSQTVERKDRFIYFSALRNGEKENYFGALVSRTGLNQTLSLPNLDAASPLQAELSVTLQGVTEIPHQVVVELNGTNLGEMLFTAQQQGLGKFSIPHSQLKEGLNSVRLIPQNGATDISLVDNLRITYQQTFVADNNRLSFKANGLEQVRISGFSSNAIRVLDITEPDSPQEILGNIEENKDGFNINIAPQILGQRTLLAFTQAAQPVALKMNQPSKWAVKKQAADFVMISSADFLADLEALKAIRQNQGYRVALVDVEDIYDEFNYGNKSPQAIKEFLAYAKQRWRVKPRFVMFVGDASHDPKNYTGAGDVDFVPTKLIDTSMMEAASDDWFVDFNQDALPDLAIGRLPVRTPDELRLIIKKLVSYASASPGQEVTLLADRNDGFDFEAASNELRSMLPSQLKVTEIFRSQNDDLTTKRNLLDALERGQLLINYKGHGSVTLWRGDLLTTDDARNLNNGTRLPMFVLMTCLNGFFTDPVLDSLAEGLIKSEQGGAIAVWASTGLTAPVEQTNLNREFYRLLFSQSGGLTIGEAIARAKASVADADIKRTWLLIGDPTLRLK